MYALIEFAGKQYKVEEGSSIKVPHVQGKIGTKVPIEKILYLEDGDNKIIGSPFIEGKKIDGEIISHGRGRKVVVFKFKRRKGYQTKNTHRNEYTILKFDKLETVKKSVDVKKSASPSPKKAAEKKETTKKRVPKAKVKKSVSPKAPTSITKNSKKEKE